MKAAISISLFCLAAGGAGGYLLRAQRTDGSLVLSLKDAMQEEYLAPPDSFSKIQNTRNSLDALSARLRMGIMDAMVAYDQLPKSNEAERTQAQQVLERAIRAAEAAEQEFEGTEQQLEITQVLLVALQKAGRFDLWTELYLKTLYEHPTHDVVAHFANDAVKISKLAGQEKLVLEALEYLSAFPAEFTGRAEILAALDTARPCFSRMQICQRAVGADSSEAARCGTSYQTTPTFCDSGLGRRQIDIR
jgi:hypothetical protein